MADRYTEIVGAKVLHQTAAAYKFELNNEEYWVPKSQSKVEGDTLYILDWIAEQKKKLFSSGGVITPAAAERLTELLREALAIIRNGH